MNIAVIGGTGRTGKAVIAEAKRRGHTVTNATRSGSEHEAADKNVQVDVAKTSDLVDLINGNDATILAIGGLAEKAPEIYRNLIAAAPTGRFIVVGGAGSLLDADGKRLVDGDFPDDWKPEALAYAEVLEDLRAAGTAVRWSFISPAPLYPEGRASGAYVVGKDSPAGERLAAEDMALALVDEAENDAHRTERFTVASA